MSAGAALEWGPSGVSVRALCPLWPQPVTVAWLYAPSKSESGVVWMRTRAFTFGAAILTSDLDERLRAVPRAVGARVRGRSVRRRVQQERPAAVGQVERLVAGLMSVISEIQTLPEA